MSFINETEPSTTSIGELRGKVCHIWQEVLRIDAIRPDDDFFEIGGHSLAASQVISRIRRDLAVEITLMEFVEQPTVAGLAEFVHAAARSERP